MRVSWLIPFTAGMFVVPMLYGVIGDDARNQIDGLALSLRTKFQASFPLSDNTREPVGNDSAPRAGLQNPQGERGPSNKAEPPDERRAPDAARPKTDGDVGSPGKKGAPAVQGSNIAPVPSPVPGAERSERKPGDSGARPEPRERWPR